ncbi:MAG: purine-nucleoside phosphorylase [Candidatus Coatesbacteria bacterium RBG_13_66_14]|uniref:Purine nucleoside phosphorylase n=1 Tax=Candidatus Coatesbacteria bacterium RBG_13_66_14 TaxID=1817816 RepID=A0A1F5EVT4_9BACT|nr:MAG: purine-nucleoside phosphorylase [Candidatus Coatesbacteria bacterium RBG_13_66_14]
MDRIGEALAFLKEKCPAPRAALVLGSGLSAAAEGLAESVALPYAGIPGFPAARVEGHPGRLTAGVFSGVPVLAFCGRFHHYEGHGMDAVTLPVRLAAGLGAETVVLTNAAGSLRTEVKPGSFLVIRDHLHMMGENPLRGEGVFTPMTGAYDAGLRALALVRARELGLEVAEGVYVGVSGPSFETPAEAEAYRRLGGDAVGMSTTPEAIVARRLGLKVLGLSAVTNYAAREDDGHGEVLRRSGAMAGDLGRWLAAIFTGLALPGGEG